VSADLWTLFVKPLLMLLMSLRSLLMSLVKDLKLLIPLPMQLDIELKQDSSWPLHAPIGP